MIKELLKRFRKKDAETLKPVLTEIMDTLPSMTTEKFSSIINEQKVKDSVKRTLIKQFTGIQVCTLTLKGAGVLSCLEPEIEEGGGIRTGINFVKPSVSCFYFPT